jgi:hypothetical protein
MFEGKARAYPSEAERLYHTTLLANPLCSTKIIIALSVFIDVFVLFTIQGLENTVYRAAYINADNFAKRYSINVSMFYVNIFKRLKNCLTSDINSVRLFRQHTVLSTTSKITTCTFILDLTSTTP